ncbi:hypothetical protein D3C76_03380 [compost metagenome]
MDLINYLDGLVVMKSLFEKDWTYWEKENSKKMESYVIENPNFQIILFRPKKQEIMLVSILFHNDMSIQALKTIEWMKEQKKLENMQSKVSKRVMHNKKNLKLTFGVENLTELREFFEEAFREG